MADGALIDRRFARRTAGAPLSGVAVDHGRRGAVNEGWG